MPRDHANVAAAGRSGRLKVVELMLDAGFDIEARADDLDDIVDVLKEHGTTL